MSMSFLLSARITARTHRLRERAEEVGVPSYLIEDASHLKVEWLKGIENGRHHGRRLRPLKIWCRS